MKYGDIELLNSRIYNLRVESLSEDPTFASTDDTRVYFNTLAKSFRFNNGTEYVDLSLPANFGALIQSLGNNWINSDFTFNPTVFNNLFNVSDLTSDNNLFDVIHQLDTAIHNLAAPELGGLEDVTLPDNITTGYILYFNNNGYTFDSLDTLIENYANVKVSSLKDVVASTLDGGSLLYNAGSDQYELTRTSVVLKDFFNTTAHSISHDLGVKYLGVQVIDAVADTVITNALIQYVDQNSLSITLNSPAPIIVILTIPYGTGN